MRGGGQLNLKLKCAFTLAEVLITLGIIGIVAAMTLPTIIQKQQEKVAITRLKQTYSILANAALMAINDYGTVDNWCSISGNYDDEYWGSVEGCSERQKDIMIKYLKNIRICDGISTYAKDACFASEYKNRFTESIWRVDYKRYSIVLANGVSVYFNSSNGDGYGEWWCKANVNTGSLNDAQYQRTCGTMVVDINGNKRPNRDGEDLFVFKVYRDGIAPSGREVDKVWNESFENQCLGKRYYGPGGCTAWVLVNENMDYLHCDDLSWDGNSKCK